LYFYLAFVRPHSVAKESIQFMKESTAMKTRISLILISMILTLSHPTQAQTSGELKSTAKAAIRQTAFDYIEGWNEGDAQRIEQALHPELAKRMVATDPKTGRSTLNQMSAMTLVQNTRKGFGTRIRKEDQLKDVTILDVFGNAACVRNQCCHLG
jgi:hypothetical protein